MKNTFLMHLTFIDSLLPLSNQFICFYFTLELIVVTIVTRFYGQFIDEIRWEKCTINRSRKKFTQKNSIINTKSLFKLKNNIYYYAQCCLKIQIYKEHSLSICKSPPILMKLSASISIFLFYISWKWKLKFAVLKTARGES